jgi:lipoprotein-releasing system permease protein
MFVAVVLIVLVASFALVGPVADPRQQARGARHAVGDGGRRRSLRRVFLLLGAALATLGIGAGGGARRASPGVLDRSGLLRLPGDVYFVDYLPFRRRTGDLAAVMAATVAVTLVASSRFRGARRHARPARLRR